MDLFIGFVVLFLFITLFNFNNIYLFFILITLFYFISFFFLAFLLSHVADRVLVLWPGIRPEPQEGEPSSRH